MDEAKNVKTLPYARNILRNSALHPLSKEQSFLPLDSLDKLPSCGSDKYFPSTKVGSY